MMASAIGIDGIDMNEPSNLQLYAQMIRFQADHAREVILLSNFDQSRSKVLHALAHSLSLACDYCLDPGTVRITRSGTSTTGLPAMTPAISGGLEGGCQYGDRPPFTGHISEELLGILPDTFKLPTSPENQDYVLQPEAMNQTGFNDIGDGHFSSLDVDFDSFINSDDQMNAMVAMKEASSFVAEIENYGLDTGLDSGELPLCLPCSTCVASQEIPNWTGGEVDGATTTGMIINPLMKPPGLLASSIAKGTQNQPIVKKTPHSTPHVGTGSAWSEWCWHEEGQTWSRCRVDENENLQYEYSEGSPNSVPIMDGNDAAQWSMPRQTYEIHDNCLLYEPVALINQARGYESSDLAYGFEQSPRSRCGSSVGSANSYQSISRRCRISRNFSRRPSIHRRTNSISYEGYEGVFDSNSIGSAASSATSFSSGRRGPLGTLARVGMKALKAVGGACWRCKILRKVCGVETPCNSCPKHHFRSDWQAVGCQRGCFTNELLAIPLCPRSESYDSNGIDLVGDDERDSFERIYSEANAFSELTIKKRENEIEEHTSFLESLDGEAKATLESLDLRSSVLQKPVPYLLYHKGAFPLYLHPALTPLNHCILGIEWEFSDLGSEPDKSTTQMFILLRAAALYQACYDSYESNSLISQSLICLRSSFELLRLENAGHLNQLDHRICPPSRCKCDCISNFTENLTLYLKELSRVFFKKENMKKIEPWWLSAFYSFCIQSGVRKSLALIERLNPAGKGSCLDIKPIHFLQRAVRLFIASSCAHDPLLRDYCNPLSGSNMEATMRVEEYKIAQVAVQRKDWASAGIKSSADYLRNIFEDDGKEIPTPTERPSDFVSGWDSDEKVDTD